MDEPLKEEPKGRLTMLEARGIGFAAHRLTMLRDLREKASSGALAVGTSYWGQSAQAFNLNKEEVLLLMDVLIQRLVSYLVQMGVEV